MRAVRQLLNISPEEDRRVAALALGWALTIAFTISGKAARDGIFLSRYDRSYLPLMVVGIAIAVAIAVAVCSRLTRFAKPRQVLAVAGAVVGASMFLFQSRLEGWMVPALYIWVEVATVILSLEFWLMASDLVDSRQAKRLFGLIAGGGSLAAVVVGSQLKPFVKLHGASGLLPLMAAFALAAGLIGMFAGRLPSLSQPPVRRREQVGPAGKFDRYVASIAMVVCAAAIVSTVVDYQFKMVAAREIQSEADLVGFFGMFSAASGLSTLVFQFLLTGRILSGLGILAGLALLPLGLGISSAYLLLSPALVAAVLVKFSDQTLKFTVHNAGLECLWLPVPYTRRQSVKPWITGTLKSSAEGLSGLATFVSVKFLPLPLLSLLVLATCAVWVWTLVRMRNFYSRALEEALRSRSIEYSGLLLDAQDPSVVVTVERSLNSPDRLEQMFALELIRDMPLGPWGPTLRNLLTNGPTEVRRRILEIAGEDARIVPDPLLAEALDSEPSVAEVAIRAAVKRRFEQLPASLARRSGDLPPVLRAAATRALYQTGVEPAKQERVLEDMLHGAEPEQLAVLRELATMPSLLPDADLAALLHSPSPPVREAALKIAEGRARNFLSSLAKVRHQARRASFQ